MDLEKASSPTKPRGWTSGLVALAALSMLAFALGIGPLASGESQGHSVILAPPPGTPAEVLRSTAQTIQRRLEGVGVRGAEVTATDDGVTVFVPGPRRILTRAVEVIAHSFRLEMREVVDEWGPDEGGYSQVALTSEGAAAEELVTYQDSNDDGLFTDGLDPKFRLGPVRLSGDAIASAHAVRVDPGEALGATPEWQVLFTLTSDGSAKFADVTARMIGEQLALVLDGVVLSAPTVEEPITGGQGVVTGGGNEEEARQLAAALASGDLPVDLSPGPIAAGRRTVSGDWFNAGTIAGTAGLVLVGLLSTYRVFQKRRSVGASGESF